MTVQSLHGGTFTMAKDLTVTRMGYGAMQLAGPHVFGPPADRDAAVAVLREAVERGITHIDTSDFYGPYVTNQIIKEALHPYPAGLHLVTKVGALRDAEEAGRRRCRATSFARPCTATSRTSAWTHSTSSTCGWEGSTPPSRVRSPNRSPCSRSSSRRG